MGWQHNPAATCARMRLNITPARDGTQTIADEDRTAVYTVRAPSHAVVAVVKTGQAGDETLARFEFRTFRPDRIVLRGAVHNAHTILAKEWFSSIRRWTASSGQSYYWSPIGVSSLILKDDSGAEVGRSHNQSRGLVGKARHDAYLELSDADEVFRDIDEIVVTFAYLKERERQDKGGRPDIV